MAHRRRPGEVRVGVFSRQPQLRPLLVPSRWEEAPRAGTIGPDFPLWAIDEQETNLHAVLKEHLFTIVEVAVNEKDQQLISLSTARVRGWICLCGESL